jgi:hypothetical protein
MSGRFWALRFIWPPYFIDPWTRSPTSYKLGSASLYKSGGHFPISLKLSDGINGNSKSMIRSMFSLKWLIYHPFWRWSGRRRKLSKTYRNPRDIH